MSSKLTDKNVRSLKNDTSKEFSVNEDGGLYLRVRPNGKKTFYCYYHIFGKKKKYTIGDYPQSSLSQARKIKEDVKLKAKNGEDPNEIKRKDKLEKKKNLEHSQTELTLKDIAETYIEGYAKTYKASWREDKRYLDHDVIPYLGNYRLSEISRQDLYGLVERLEKRGAQTGRNGTCQPRSDSRRDFS